MKKFKVVSQWGEQIYDADRVQVQDGVLNILIKNPPNSEYDYHNIACYAKWDYFANITAEAEEEIARKQANISLQLERDTQNLFMKDKI